VPHVSPGLAADDEVQASVWGRRSCRWGPACARGLGSQRFERGHQQVLLGRVAASGVFFGDRPEWSSLVCSGCDPLVGRSNVAGHRSSARAAAIPRSRLSSPRLHTAKSCRLCVIVIRPSRPSVGSAGRKRARNPQALTQIRTTPPGRWCNTRTGRWPRSQNRQPTPLASWRRSRRRWHPGLGPKNPGRRASLSSTLLRLAALCEPSRKVSWVTGRVGSRPSDRDDSTDQVGRHTRQRQAGDERQRSQPHRRHAPIPNTRHNRSSRGGRSRARARRP
jgi:hypothetical protein